MAQPDGTKHAFYAYMFQKNKQPTPQLDELLRGIARHIIKDVGDKKETTLTPAKLAAFYKAVGGNYDALFVDIPHSSLSYIYSSTGCEHTLQPTGDDYAPPSIPALTVRGFSRWQSIEILLGPEEHVPFVQRAVKNFGIRDDQNELFPPILPAEVFPQHPDPDIERWHTNCAEKLRREATPKDEPSPPLPRRPKVHVQESYTYVPAPRPTRDSHNVRDDIPSTRFPSIRRVRPTFNRNSSYHGVHAPNSPRSSRSRRRSFPENSSSPNLTMPTPNAPENLKPPVDERNRRHSHPRHERSPSTSSVSSSERQKRGPKDIPIAEEGRKPQRRYPYQPQYQSTPIRFYVPQNLRPEPDSPHRSNSHSSSNSHGAGTRHSRNNSDNDSIRERRRANTSSNHPPISMDITGSLSSPFMQGLPSRSNSRVKRVGRNDISININDHHLPGSRRMSVNTPIGTDEDMDEISSGVYHRKRGERSARSQDRGRTDRKRREREREREREQDREREREVERERGREKERGGLFSRSASIGAKLGLKFRRGVSHEEKDRDERERERGRERARSRERRELRDRREFGGKLGSPTRVVDAARWYPHDGVIRR